METVVVLLFWGAIAWGVWRLFLKKWFSKQPIAKSARAHVAASQISDEAYYAMAGEELLRGQVRNGLWLKALSECQGDETKARARYLTLRVRALRAEAATTFKTLSEMEERRTAGSAPSSELDEGRKELQGAVMACPNCHVGLRFPRGRELEVRCTRCGYSFHWQT